MRMRKKPWCVPELDACPFCIRKPEEQKGRWHSLFPRSQPLHMELGCGKGGFISAIAPAHPEINYIAMDMIDEMLGLAKRKLEAAYLEKNQPADNILILIQNIERIDRTFGPEDQAQRLYINFCNPWPRSKHHKRRLTHPRQLEHYQTFLQPGGEIWFKTDDDTLFAASRRYFQECGFTFRFETEDLHHSGFMESPPTEHEAMFTEMGLTTKFLIAVSPLSKEACSQ